MCILHYRIEHFLRRRKGRKGTKRRGRRGVAKKGDKKEKRTASKLLHAVIWRTEPLLSSPQISFGRSGRNSKECKGNVQQNLRESCSTSLHCFSWRSLDGVRVLFGSYFPCWSFNKASNRTALGQPPQNLSEPYLDKGIPLRRALRRLLS